MEYKELTIKSLSFDDTKIYITYSNDSIETIIKNSESYLDLYDDWLLDNPMFISDKYKTQMRELFFAGKNNDIESINNLNNFLSEKNKEEALKFINYMRTRDLTDERKKWSKGSLPVVVQV